MAIFTVLGNLTDIITMLILILVLMLMMVLALSLMVMLMLLLMLVVISPLVLWDLRWTGGVRSSRSLRGPILPPASPASLSKIFKQFAKKSFFSWGRFARICPDKRLAKKRSTVMLYTVSVPLVIFFIEDLKTITYLLTTHVQMGQPTGLDWSDWPSPDVLVLMGALMCGLSAFATIPEGAPIPSNLTFQLWSALLRIQLSGRRRCYKVPIFVRM